MRLSLSKVCKALSAGLSALLGAGLVSACSNDGKVAGGTEAESTFALQVQLADGAPALSPEDLLQILPGEGQVRSAERKG